jgi:hypothetical protein
MSPHQVRQAGALAFRAHQRAIAPASIPARVPAFRRAPGALSAHRGRCQPAPAIITPAPPAGPLPLRAAWPGETPLSPLELIQGIRDGVIDRRSV